MNIKENKDIKNFLNKEFYEEKHKDIRKWFFKNFSKTEQLEFKDKYYTDLQRNKKLEYFIPWFLKYYIQHQEKQIRVIEEHYKQWKSATGMNIRSIYPPTDALKISGIHSSNLETSAFVKQNESNDVTLKELNKLFKQNNYTNLHLQIVGNHLTRIEDDLDKLINKFNEVIPSLKILETNKISNTNSEKTKVMIKPPIDISGFKRGDEVTSDIIELLTKKFNSSKLNMVASTSSIVQTESSEDDNSENELTQNELLTLENQFSSINKIKNPSKRIERYYYKRPTPTDVLFEENDTYIQSDYNGRNIYEWNIDGASDSLIYSTMHRMMMYSTVCRQNGNTDKIIAQYITCGFTGVLKGWWDN